MHYRHGFHAGNFADVFKHTLLCALLGELSRKDAPWFYLETHSGAGLYELAAEADRTGEWREGIGRMLDLATAPEAVAGYLQAVRALQPAAAPGSRPTPLVYPGSPLIALACARAGDRLALCEKVPEAAARLKDAVSRDARAAVHRRDGYEAASLLPPREKRGLILIDPPFERRDEFEVIGKFLERALARFAHGVYAVWYPLKNRFAVARFLRRQTQPLARPALEVFFDTGAKAQGQMHACGMLVINPPFGFEAAAKQILAFLARRLAQGPRPQWSVAAVAG